MILNNMDKRYSISECLLKDIEHEILLLNDENKYIDNENKRLKHEIRYIKMLFILNNICIFTYIIYYRW